MINYLLIDDEEDKGDGFALNFKSKREGINTLFLSPKSWEKQIEHLKFFVGGTESPLSLKEKEALKAQIPFLKQKKVDGIILDLKLDEKNNFHYKGNSIAQEIRNLSTESIITDCPLILFSAPNNLNAIYKPDNTSHDLFDLKISKTEVNRTFSKKARKKLISLAKGYQILNETKNINTLLKITDEELLKIDYRMVDYFNALKARRAPSHEYARFVLRRIIWITNDLIDEYVLGARFGINVLDENNRAEWYKLKETLTKSKYNGIFSDGWERWWMIRINQWWNQHFESNLGNLTAAERVKLLNKTFALNLTPAVKTKNSRSTYFWTICQKSKIPIAVDDGILASKKHITSAWEEDDFYCIEEALKLNKLNIHPLERKRLQRIKNRLSHKNN